MKIFTSGMCLFLVFFIFGAGYEKHQLSKISATDWHVAGSAFIVNSNGDIATAAHVVGKEKYMYIRYNGVPYIADVIFVNYNKDVAFLHINNLCTAYLAFQTQYDSTCKAYVFGYPLPDVNNYKLKCTEGVAWESFEDGVSTKVLKFTAKVCGGNSGGPILSDYGVVGLVTNKYYWDSAGAAGYGTTSKTIVELAQANRIKVYYSTSFKMSLTAWRNCIYRNNLVVWIYK